MNTRKLRKTDLKVKSEPTNNVEIMKKIIDKVQSNGKRRHEGEGPEVSRKNFHVPQDQYDHSPKHPDSSFLLNKF